MNTKKRIVIASTNPIKIRVVARVAQSLSPGEEFEVISCNAEKDGSEPFGKKAIVAQLDQALEKSKKEFPEAAFYVAMEGGVEDEDNVMHELACVIIEETATGQRSLSQAATFEVPPEVAIMVRKGKPFAEAVEQFLSVRNVKSTKGFVGLLTDNYVDKEALYFQPTMVAFSKFKKIEWYK